MVGGVVRDRAQGLRGEASWLVPCTPRATSVSNARGYAVYDTNQRGRGVKDTCAGRQASRAPVNFRPHFRERRYIIAIVQSYLQL